MVAGKGCCTQRGYHIAQKQESLGFCPHKGEFMVNALKELTGYRGNACKHLTGTQDRASEGCIDSPAIGSDGVEEGAAHADWKE